MAAEPLIYFIRHGETDWNRSRRIQGRTDTELNATGRAQATAVAGRVRQVVDDAGAFQLHCSPLRRARDTMAAVVAALGLSEHAVRYDERLSEKSFGAFEGLTWPELFAAGGDPGLEPDAFYAWRPDGGESYADVAARAAPWLERLDGPAIVVSHSGVSRVLRGLLLGLPKAEVVHLPVPQDRFFRVSDGQVEWFDLEDYHKVMNSSCT